MRLEQTYLKTLNQYVEKARCKLLAEFDEWYRVCYIGGEPIEGAPEELDGDSVRRPSTSRKVGREGGREGERERRRRRRRVGGQRKGEGDGECEREQQNGRVEGDREREREG